MRDSAIDTVVHTAHDNGCYVDLDIHEVETPTGMTERYLLLTVRDADDAHVRAEAQGATVDQAARKIRKQIKRLPL